MRLLDLPDLPSDTATKFWNSTVDLLDATVQLPEDDIRLVRFRDLQTTSAANPEGVSLRSLFECSARCGDFIRLRSWGLKPAVQERLAKILTTGIHYNSLFPFMAELVPPEWLPLALCRVCGLALQAPLLSIHTEPAALADSIWEQVVPTWRFERIIEHLRNTRESAEAIATDPGLPERVCNALGWPTVSSLLERAITEDFFRGTDSLVGFATAQHLAFCEFTVDSPLHPVWIPDLVLNTKLARKSGFEGQRFYPPFHFAGGEIVTHPTCTDMKQMIDILLIYATSTAAQELLDSEDLDLPRTHAILDSYLRWVSPRNEEVKRYFADELVPAAFDSILGFVPRRYERLT